MLAPDGKEETEIEPIVGVGVGINGETIMIAPIIVAIAPIIAIIIRLSIFSTSYHYRETNMKELNQFLFLNFIQPVYLFSSNIYKLFFVTMDNVR
jgi:uncharacterized membrane protein YesL